MQAKLAKLLSRLKQEESKPNSEVEGQKAEGKWSRKYKELGPCRNLAGLRKFATCKISQVAKFRNLLPVSCLTHFLPTFSNFFLNYPLCIIGSSYIFCNFPCSEQYIRLNEGFV